MKVLAFLGGITYETYIQFENRKDRTYPKTH